MHVQVKRHKALKEGMNSPIRYSSHGSSPRLKVIECVFWRVAVESAPKLNHLNTTPNPLISTPN